MMRLLELFVAFLAGIYGTLLFVNDGYPPEYPQLASYQKLASVLFLLVFATWSVVSWRERKRSHD